MYDGGRGQRCTAPQKRQTQRAEITMSTVQLLTAGCGMKHCIAGRERYMPVARLEIGDAFENGSVEEVKDCKRRQERLRYGADNAGDVNVDGGMDDSGGIRCIGSVG